MQNTIGLFKDQGLDIVTAKFFFHSSLRGKKKFEIPWSTQIDRAHKYGNCLMHKNQFMFDIFVCHTNEYSQYLLHFLYVY